MESYMEKWDAIVVGSGMGGLSCAAALAKFNYRVLVLEQDEMAGGLTKSFSRNGWSWDVGMHYLGDLGPDGIARRLYDWLSGGSIKVTSMGSVYDTLHFPDNFRITLSRPEAALKLDLKERFPHAGTEIDAFFDAMRDAQKAGHAIFAMRGMPAPFARVAHFFQKREISRWCERTTQQVLDELISDAKLKAVLSAQWGDYGSPPQQSSFAIHATVIREYFNGAFYPDGGGNIFAKALGRTIEAAGGKIQTHSRVTGLSFNADAVDGAVLENAAVIRAPRVISNIGARNSILKLLPRAMHDSPWSREVLSIPAAPGFLSLFIGFEGDIAANGATVSNHWIHASWNAGEDVVKDPTNDDISWFMVSFPSLKDRQHDPGLEQKHTGDMLTLVDWQAFAPWQDSTAPDYAGYQEFKKLLEKKMLAALQRHFPALIPLIKYTELATPLTTAKFTGAYHGASYGLETSPRRFLSQALNAKTPVPGFYLTGQDVGTPGLQGAMWGGLMTAGAIDPRVFQHL
jgi:all-trans-retinol 13,14-reductase